MSSMEIMESRRRIVGSWMETYGATGRCGSCLKDLQSSCFGGLGLERNVGLVGGFGPEWRILGWMEVLV